MNGYQRIRAALAGEWPDRRPVMLHNFLMAAREAGVTMAEYRRSPEAIARCFIQAVERYDYDGIVVDVDTATLAGALGVPVDFPEDGPARCTGPAGEPLSGDVSAYWGVQVWLEAVRLLRRHFGDAVWIRGNCDQAPFALAALVRGPAQWLMDLMEEKAGSEETLQRCAAATAQFIRLMAEAGAHMVSNGDSPAGPDFASPRLYMRYARPYEQRMVEVAHSLGRPYVLHICGKTDRILEDMLSTGADGLELDYKTGAALAHRLMLHRAVFIGNLDPSAVLALGTPRQVEEKTRELLAVFADTPRFVLNAGCAIPASTPPGNLRAMLRAARQGA